MRAFRYIGIMVLASLVLIGSVGIHIVLHQCYASNQIDVVISISPVKHDIKGHCCINETVENSCMFCHLENEHKAGKNHCDTNEKFLSINTDFLVKNIQIVSQPVFFTLLQLYSSGINHLENELTRVFEQLYYTPPKPLWGQSLLKNFHSFKFHICL